MLTIEKVKTRCYVVGPEHVTKPFRQYLKDAGCAWDSERQQWWCSTRKQAKLEHAIARIEAMQSAAFTIRPRSRAYNDLIRDKGGVWDKTRETWLLPSAKALAAVSQEIAADEKREQKQKAAQKAAKEAREAAAKKTPDQVLEEAGRTRREGKAVSYTTSLGHGKRAVIEQTMVEVGEIRMREDGPWLVIAVERPYFVSDDSIEDMDAWSSFEQGAGWYQAYTAIPVNRTPEEQAKADAKAVDLAKQKRRGEIVNLVKQLANYTGQATTAGLALLWGDARAAGSETLLGDLERLVYRTSSYDDGPHYWELFDTALATEAQGLRQ